MHVGTLPDDLKKDAFESLLGRVEKQNPELFKSFTEDEIKKLRDETKWTTGLLRRLERLYEAAADMLPLIYAVASLALVGMEAIATP